MAGKGIAVFIAAVLAALIFGYAVLAGTATVRPPYEPFDLLSIRVLNVLLVVAVAAGFVVAAIRKRALEALLYILALAVLLSGMYLYLHRYECTVALAEDEQFSTRVCIDSDTGLLADEPVFPEIFSIRNVEPEGRQGYVTILRGGKVEALGAGGLKMNGYSITFEKTGPALLFHVGLEKTASVEEAYMKLNLDNPRHEDSFMFRMLPFQFFVRRGQEDGTFILDARRGKRSIYEGGYKIGNVADFDGMKVTLKNERKYAVLKVSRTPGMRLFVIFASAFLLVLVFWSVRSLRARRT